MCRRWIEGSGILKLFCVFMGGGWVLGGDIRGSVGTGGGGYMNWERGISG